MRKYKINLEENLQSFIGNYIVSNLFVERERERERELFLFFFFKNSLSESACFKLLKTCESKI